MSTWTTDIEISYANGQKYCDEFYGDAQYKQAERAIYRALKNKDVLSIRINGKYCHMLMDDNTWFIPTACKCKKCVPQISEEQNCKKTNSEAVTQPFKMADLHNYLAQKIIEARY